MHDRAHRRRASARAHRSFFRTTSSHSPRTTACCRCARRSSRPRSSGRIPQAPAVHQHQPHRRDVGASACRRCVAPAFACSASASRASRRSVLAEFNKAQIHRHIEPMLTAALAAGITPFLDLILSSPRASLQDVAETLREAYRWLRRGCEIGMYPYVIPFSGAALAQDRTLLPHTVSTRRRVAGTSVEWDQPCEDPADRSAVSAMRYCEIERDFEAMLATLERAGGAPAFAGALAVWILSALPVMARARLHHRGSTTRCMPSCRRDCRRSGRAIGAPPSQTRDRPPGHLDRHCAASGCARCWRAGSRMSAANFEVGELFDPGLRPGQSHRLYRRARLRAAPVYASPPHRDGARRR